MNWTHWTELLGYALIEVNEDEVMTRLLFANAEGRRVLVLERTYRPGKTRIFDEPSEADLYWSRHDPWKLWNSKRGR